MNPARFITLTIVFVLALTAPILCREFLTNGDFENPKAALAGWTVEHDGAEVVPNRIGGRWLTIKVTFNSEDCTRINLYIGAYSTPAGRCWVDNVRSEGLQISNGSFETLTPDGKSFAGWSVERPGQWLHVSRERASDGRTSIMYCDPSFAAQMIRLMQVVDVKPNTDYSYSYDFFMDDDFYGAIRCGAITVPPAAYRALNSKYFDVDQIIADRSVAGNQQCKMVLDGGTASISQTAGVPLNIELSAGVSIKTAQLEGNVTLEVLGPETDSVLASKSLADSAGAWRDLRVRFVATSPNVRVRLRGRGTGEVYLDSVSVSFPQLLPAPQQVTWKTRAEAFGLSSPLNLDLQGPGGDLLHTGLGILRKDLAALDVALDDKSPAGAGLVVCISDDLPDALQDKGDESYSLVVSPDGIRIDASAERGAFYGIMTLLQLLREKTQPTRTPHVTGCEIVDWPDFPWRSIFSARDPEWMARRKLNRAENLDVKRIPDYLKFGIISVPHDNITHYPLRPRKPEDIGIIYDPNMAEGVAKTEKLTLRGATVVELSGRNVIRTKRIDITVKALDGRTTYALDKDFRIIPGDIGTGTFPSGVASYDDNAKPFAIARIPAGRIGDGEAVSVSYEHVPPHSGMAVLCLAELDVQETIARNAKRMVAEHNLPFMSLLVSEEPRIIGKGPRCKATGLSASQLLARYYRMLDEAVKEANPDCRIFVWSDDFMPWQHSPRSGLADAAELLPKDAVVGTWHYAAGDVASFNVKTARLWSQLGHDFTLMGWYDYRNIRGTAAVALWARQQGMPCLGTSSWAYPVQMRRGGSLDFLDETIRCSWRGPRAGEPGYVDPAELDALLEKIADPRP